MAITEHPSLRDETPPERSPAPSEQAPPDDGWAPDKRFLGLAIVIDVVALILAYVAVTVPVEGPRLTSAEKYDHWIVAAAGAMIVLIGFVVVVLLVRSRPKVDAVPAQALVEADAQAGQLPKVPRTLKFERTSRATTRNAAIASAVLFPALWLLGAPAPLVWFSVLAPWIPLVALEARYKRARYGVFALFVLMGLLQMLHMVEHSVQVGQLVATSGDLSRSHGIFGQLDFELVHFVTDTLLWLGLGMLVTIVRERNVWLWVAFIAASMHEVEHLYLFWLHIFDNNFYLAGGFSGVLGHHGLIGSPLDRPYLHYTYNLIVFVPMLIAIWDEARRMDVRHPVGEVSAPSRPAVA
jgi:hypothetical protein